MKESGYYPAGAEFDPRAPWNEVELPPKDVEVTISAIVTMVIMAFKIHILVGIFVLCAIIYWICRKLLYIV